jgi:hypothetical protein
MGVYVIGADALAAKFSAAAATLMSESPAWLVEAGNIVETSVRGVISSEGLYETGALYGSGRTFGQTGNSILVGFGQGLDYAMALEKGAAPHSIDAKNVSALSFYWENAGQWFFGPHVNHPGNRPYAFMRNGAEASLVPLAFMFMEKIRAILGMGL